jgi:hypothetical protein
MVKMSKKLYIKSIEEKKTYKDKTVYEYINGKHYCEQEYVSKDHQIIVTFSDHDVKVYPFYYYVTEAHYFHHLICCILMRLGDGMIEVPEGLKQRVDELYDSFSIKERLKEMNGGPVC